MPLQLAGHLSTSGNSRLWHRRLSARRSFWWSSLATDLLLLAFVCLARTSPSFAEFALTALPRPSRIWNRQLTTNFGSSLVVSTLHAEERFGTFPIFFRDSVALFHNHPAAVTQDRSLAAVELLDPHHLYFRSFHTLSSKTMLQFRHFAMFPFRTGVLAQKGHGYKYNLRLASSSAHFLLTSL